MNRKHSKYHSKSHACHLCPRPRGFATSRDLSRHQQDVHKVDMGQDTWECTVVGCKKRGKPFSRKWNCKRHYESCHPLLDLQLVGL
jgi:hypothetical protein